MIKSKERSAYLNALVEAYNKGFYVPELESLYNKYDGFSQALAYPNDFGM